VPHRRRAKLPNLDKNTADPTLLKPALDRGVTTILAHCGTRSTPWDTDFIEPFMRVVKDYQHAYGDTSALNLPTRSYAYDSILKDDRVREKLVHGSDWPILPVPPISKLGVSGATLFTEMNWMKRDLLIKRKLGFDDAYWHRRRRCWALGNHRLRICLRPHAINVARNKSGACSPYYAKRKSPVILE